MAEKANIEQDMDIGTPVHHVDTYVRNTIHDQELGHETDVVLLDAGAAHLEKGDLGHLKLAKDGHTVLVPQPTESMLRPTPHRVSFANSI